MEALSFVNYSFYYPNETAPALKDINVNIKSGEFILLCGEIGSGKTTLLRSIKKELAPVGEKSGKIYAFEKDISTLKKDDSVTQIGYVSQSPDNQIVMESVWHELAFGLENMGYKSNVIRRKIAEIVNFFGIEDIIDKKTNALSGGQKQLLNLAGVMAMQPKILLLDEPTAQLDPISASEFFKTVGRINKETGMTVVISEHRLQEVLPLSDRVLFIKDGEIKINKNPFDFVKEIYNLHADFAPALPDACKIAYRLGEKDNFPISVNEGRRWLEKVNKPLKSTPNVQKQEKKKAVLKARDLWFRYDKNDSFLLKGLSFDLYEGEIHSILGGNGCGKSTLMYLLCGCYKLSRGRVSKKDNKQISLLIQNPKLNFLCDTVSEELKELKDVYGYSQKDIDNMVAKFNLSKLLTKHPYDLSGGEMQSLALAKILLLSPDILLLDEPTKSLDAKTKKEILKLLLNLKASGKSIVIVTHDLDFACTVSDRISMMSNGDIVCTDLSKSFFENNMFYTTAANRITREIVPGCVLPEDISYDE